MSPSNPLCCCRCRRESHGHSGMFQFGTNLYYCSHCAKMVGYSAG
jgi:late competence protein required for DNA uptake (superfamily II DNA/RNA helicase)